MKQNLWSRMFALSLLLHLSLITILGLKTKGPSRKFEPFLSYSVNLVDAIPEVKGPTLGVPKGYLKEDIERTGGRGLAAPREKGKKAERKALEDIKSLSPLKGKAEDERAYLERRLREIRQKIAYMDVEKGRAEGSPSVSRGLPLSGPREAGSTLVDPAFYGYVTELWEKVKKAWRPPVLGSEKKDLETVVVLRIRKDGRITDLEIEKRSGDRLYDESVIRALKQVDPLPPFPPSLKEEAIEIGLRFLPGGVS